MESILVDIYSARPVTLFKKKNLSGTLSKFQMVWIQVRTDILSALIWVQTVFKDQQTTKVGKS